MKYSYENTKKSISRMIEFNDGKKHTSKISVEYIKGTASFSKKDEYEQRWLQCTRKPSCENINGDIRVVDLFCGCGGLTLGIEEACRALNYNFVPVLAADISSSALDLYNKNFSPQYVIDNPIENYVDSDLGEEMSEKEKLFVDMIGAVDVLIGGPPCQGNSDLNNHTRRTDPRNLLYIRMIRCAELLKPRFLIIENVPGVQHDTHQVVDIAKERLNELGYHVDSGVIDMSMIGVAQKRKRFFLIASLEYEVSMEKIIKNNICDLRNMGWAIEDLLDINGEDVFDTPANSSETNRKRIDYLFDHDLYDLPNSERPDCHKLKNHSYTAVYGRMHWDIPSPTITGGFGSNGQGRFIHPYKRRTITPHEAARIQFFPDYFDFSGVKRRELQQIIGNAVPSKASYILGIDFLSKGELRDE